MKLRSKNSQTNSSNQIPPNLPLSREVKFISYQKSLVSRARELRNNPTPAEAILWEKVFKGDKLLNLRFLRQKPLDGFIVDFYCAELMIAVEVDGEVHFKHRIRDKERDDLLYQKFRIKVLRYDNKDIINNLDEVVSKLISTLSPLIKG